MGHLGYIADYSVARDVLADCKCQLAGGIPEFLGFQYLPESYCILVYVRDLDTYGRLARDRRFYTHSLRRKTKCDIVLKSPYFRYLNACSRLELVTCDRRSSAYVAYFHFNAEALECVYYGLCLVVHLLYRIRTVGAYIGRGKQVDTRKYVQRSLVLDRCRGSFLFNSFRRSSLSLFGKILRSLIDKSIKAVIHRISRRKLVPEVWIIDEYRHIKGIVIGYLRFARKRNVHDKAVLIGDAASYSRLFRLSDRL